MATFLNILDETILALTGYTNRQDQATYLLSNIGSSDLSFQVSDGTVLTRGLVEIDDELICMFWLLDIHDDPDCKLNDHDV